jgi:hypothetical protein
MTQRLEPRKDTKKREKASKLARAQIVEAATKGRKTVTIEGVVFSITIKKSSPNVTVGGETKKVHEKWIIAQPAAGGLPVYNLHHPTNTSRV